MLNPQDCKNGCEQWEVIHAPSGTSYLHYNFRASDGQLFSCVSLGLCQAQARRDIWLSGRSIHPLLGPVPPRKMSFILDGAIDLFAHADDCSWHLAWLTNRLMNLGIREQDAQTFSHFTFQAAASASLDIPDPHLCDALTAEELSRILVIHHSEDTSKPTSPY